MYKEFRRRAKARRISEDQNDQNAPEWRKWPAMGGVAWSCRSAHRGWFTRSHRGTIRRISCAATEPHENPERCNDLGTRRIVVGIRVGR